MAFQAKLTEAEAGKIGTIIADKCGFAEELKCKWEAQANGKPQKQKDELQTINRRLNELDRLIGSLYENFISGLLVQVPDEEILC